MAKKYKLDFGVQIIDWLIKSRGEWTEETLPQWRKQENEFLARGFRGRIQLHHIENRKFSGRHGAIPVRIYRATAREDAPLIVFYHGGGFTIGSLDGYDHICRTIAENSGAVVISVDYRLAPEHKFPVATEDSYDALCEAVDIASEIGANSGKVIVMGDSAGGNLATVMALMAYEKDAPHITGQVLIYPVVDSSVKRPSRTKFSDAPVLPESTIDFFQRMYLRDEADMQDPYCSPLLAESHHDLPPVLIQVAEYDPLLDEGIAYAEILRVAGVDVKEICYPRMVHGFYSIGAFASQTKNGYADIADFVKNLL